jgi:hypothetical protein
LRLWHLLLLILLASLGGYYAFTHRPLTHRWHVILWAGDKPVREWSAWGQPSFTWKGVCEFVDSNTGLQVTALGVLTAEEETRL